MFTGPDNETAHGWLLNDEQFHAFYSWRAGDTDHSLEDADRFCVL